MDQLFLFAIISFGILRWFVAKQRTGKSSKFLLVSCFVQTLPFSYGVTLYSFINKEMLGSFGTGIRFEMTFLFSIIFLLLGYNQFNRRSLYWAENRWSYLFLFFCVLSVINPFNAIPLAPLVPLSFFIQMYFLLKIIQANFSRLEIFNGILDGLKYTTLLQFALCIFYPVLGIQEFSSMFKDGSGKEWAERRSGFPSAVGTFIHPAHLALFSFITMLFFFSCYLNGKVKEVVPFIGLNLFIIFLTYSRTTYLVLFAVLVILYVTYRGNQAIFSLKNIFKFIGFFSLVLFILYFTPLSDFFLKSDSSEQFDNRFVHFVLGLEIWQTSKWIGLGMNSHVYFMAHKFLTDPFGGRIPLEFFVTNPIHNIHLIVLCELGILGLLSWLFYFVSRIYKFSSKVRVPNRIDGVFNLTFVGILFTVFIYGFFGWSPFDFSIIGISLFLGFFSTLES